MFHFAWRPVAAVILLIASIAGFIYYFADHPSVRHQLAATSLVSLLLLTLLYIAVIGALCLVTYTTLHLCRVQLKPGETVLLTMYSTVINFFGPLQSGPAFRGIYLKRKHNLSLKLYASASLVFYGLYALVSGAFLLSGILQWWLLILLLAAALAGYVARKMRAISRHSKRFLALDLHVTYGLALATMLQLGLVVVIYFVELRSVDHAITFGQAVIYAGAANLSLFVSLTPGAIGFRESFLVFTRSLHHVSTDTIVAANILDRSIYILIVTVLAVGIFASHAHHRFRRSSS